jgi:hypothetical protein
MRLLMTALSLFLGLILFLVGGRFLLLLLNANKSNEIVDWVLRHSDYWVKPFFDLFDLSNKAVSETGGVFEPASLIAFVVYAVIGGIILEVLSNAFSHEWSWGAWRHA